MAIITYSDVYSFCGTKANQQTSSRNTALTAEIARNIDIFEQKTGRKIQSTAFSNVSLQDGINCQIFKDTIFLHGIYRDTYTISSLYEEGELLTQSTTYDDGGDYVLDVKGGMIFKIGGNWSTAALGIKLSGSTGIGGASAPLESINLYLLQATAISAGLWVTNSISYDGTPITSRVKNLPEETKRILAQYMPNKIL